MYELHNGDCLDVMRSMAANTVDTILTDPPYGLKFMGKDWDHGIPGESYWAEALRVAKPGALLLAFGGTRTWHRLAVAIEDAGWELRDTLMWLYGQGFPKSLDISKAIDKAAGAEREVVRMATRGGNSERRGEGAQGATYGDAWGGFTTLSAPATPDAARWQGWGTALKPAFEPVIVAQKPVDGTYAHNAEQWGVAGFWIDGGRIGTDAGWSYPKGRGGCGWHGVEGLSRNIHEPMKATSGRWPANLILSEDAAAEMGEVSRYFYTPKASRAERNAGLEGMPLRTPGQCTDRKDGSAGLNSPRAGAGRTSGGQNDHPTVKPLALMRYLARLTKTPTGGVVLDPFMGSGTTGMACVLEGRGFIGIELDAHYLEIAGRRIAWAETQREPEPVALPLMVAAE